MNIILIMSDTFRWDNLFDRAAMPVRTPRLDAFAERAVSVDQALIGSFPTVPQRTDMTSGRIGWPWYGWQDRHNSTPNHLPELLNQAGYVSQLIGDCPHVFGCNFHHGFTANLRIRGQEGDLFRLRLNDPVTEVQPREKTRTGRGFQGGNLADVTRWQNADWKYETDRLPPRTAAEAVRFLEDSYRYDPFFLWVDFFDPHEPWDPPEYMVRRYDPDYRGTPMLHPNYGKASDLTKAELRNLRAHYCAEAELVDRYVGRVLEKVDDLGLWDNTVVVFTSDHGISLGEHNRTGKSNINERDDRYWPLYPEIARVPMMFAAPGLPGGRKVDHLAQPADILPTVLDLAGLDVQPPEPLHGKSLAALLRGDSRKAVREFVVSGQHHAAWNSEKPFPMGVTPVLYTKKWAYVPIGPTGARELYDRTSDPLAARNVLPANRDTADKLHRKLLRWLKEIDSPEALPRLLET